MDRWSDWMRGGEKGLEIKEMMEIKVGGGLWVVSECHVDSRTVYLIPYFPSRWACMSLFVSHSFFVLLCEFSLTNFPQPATQICFFPSPPLPSASLHTLTALLQVHAHIHSATPSPPERHSGFLVSICRGLASCLTSCNPRSLLQHIHSRGEGWWAPAGLKGAWTWEGRPCLIGTVKALNLLRRLTWKWHWLCYSVLISCWVVVIFQDFMSWGGS